MKPTPEQAQQHTELHFRQPLRGRGSRTGKLIKKFTTETADWTVNHLGQYQVRDWGSAGACAQARESLNAGGTVICEMYVVPQHNVLEVFVPVVTVKARPEEGLIVKPGTFRVKH